VREDVLAFFENLATQSHWVLCIVILHNAAIDKGDIMEKHRRRWAKKGL
jgi:hypothetical protein